MVENEEKTFCPACLCVIIRGTKDETVRTEVPLERPVARQARCRKTAELCLHDLYQIRVYWNTSVHLKLLNVFFNCIYRATTLLPDILAS